MNYFTFIFSLLKSIKILNDWVELFVIEYLKWKQERLIEINKEEINNALKNKDQRRLESPEVSGKPSGVGHIVSELPRMRDKKSD